MWTGFNKCSMFSYLQTLQTIKNIGKKDWKGTVLCQQRGHTVWHNKTVQNYSMSKHICEQLPLPVQLFISVQCETKAWNLWLLNISVDPVCQSWYHMDMGHIAVVTEIPAVTIFKVNWLPSDLRYGTTDCWQHLCITHKGGVFFVIKCNRAWLDGTGQDMCTKHGLARVWSKVLQRDSL